VRGANASGLIVAPFHPIFVHFSIALTGVSFAFDLASVVLDTTSLATAGWWTLAVSALVTPGTIVTGIVSRLRLPMEEGPARSYLRAHMALGPIFFGGLLVMAIWRAAFWTRMEAPRWTYLAAMAGLVIVMTIQGYLGGELVYRFGAEVRGRFRELPSARPEGPPRAGASRRTHDDSAP
jgi:uncharacterized membrane protein